MPMTRLLLATALLTALVACSGGGSGSTTPPPVNPPAGQEVVVEVRPRRVTLRPGESYPFNSVVTGTADTGVTWSVDQGGGSVTATGVYTAPIVAGNYKVKGSSKANPSSNGYSNVTVTPTPTPTVAISPLTASVAAGGTLAFSAVVTGSTNTGVTWSIQEGNCGSIDATGLYSAPPFAASCRIIATSAASTSSTDVATVTVTAPAQPPPPVAVTLSPTSTTVAAGGTVSFTATVTGTTNGAVTWSVQEASGCGSVDTSGTYTAPGAAATCHVVATSAASASATAAATVTVTAPTLPPPVVSVTVSPATGAVNSCMTLAFTATVSGTTNSAVTWSVQEGAAGGSVSAAGVYTAPAVAGTYHVIATSQASTSASATVPVTVTDKILGVSVSPSSNTVSPGATAQFNATVTTTCGTFAAQ